MKHDAGQKKHFPFPPVFCLCFVPLLAACSFDYGETGETVTSKPDIVLEDLEYVRVRGGGPVARFTAEYAEHWEESQTMNIRDLSFEQFENNGDTVNAEGKSGTGTVRLDSGDITLKDGVRINIESEDIIISTSELEWKDKEKTLSGGENDTVAIERPDGTSFSGTGFSAGIRGRTWAFSGEVKGTYVEEDEDEDGVSAVENGGQDAAAKGGRLPPEQAGAEAVEPEQADAETAESVFPPSGDK